MRKEHRNPVRTANTVPIIYHFPGWFESRILMGMVSFLGAENILELDIVCTQCYQIVHFKIVNVLLYEFHLIKKIMCHFLKKIVNVDEIINLPIFTLVVQGIFQI